MGLGLGLGLGGRIWGRTRICGNGARLDWEGVREMCCVWMGRVILLFDWERVRGIGGVRVYEEGGGEIGVGVWGGEEGRLCELWDIWRVW